MKKKRNISIAFILIAVVSLISACSPKKEANSEGKIEVVTSFYPMYEFTKNIVGDEGNVEMLISAGTEAHDYEPSAKDMRHIQDADVFVYNNENMETWVPSISSTLKDGNVHVVKATENMILLAGSEEDHEHEEGDGHSHELDPHVWLAPNLAMEEVKEIRDQLIAAYPEKKEVFTKNAEAYLQKLQTLNQLYSDTLDKAEEKNFVTQHSAFGYLALEYGLNQVPISGLSSSEEPTASRIAKLKKYVSDNNIHYIYFEENASDSVARTLAKEANVELLVLNPLESLTDEQMKNGEDYISVMEDNLKSLTKTTNSGETSKLDTENTKVEKTVINGYFKDSDVKDRPLSNWSGDWQSVYPYVEDGTFDQIFDYKAKINKDKTADEYKKYYEVGYKTDIESIKITDKSMTFTYNDGKEVSSEYNYSGYKILDYEAGNRGVRYCFEAVDSSTGAFKYVQFSDHTITDTHVSHFHIFFGNESQDALYQQLDNWPTYYTSNLSGQEIAQEMMAH